MINKKLPVFLVLTTGLSISAFSGWFFYKADEQRVYEHLAKDVDVRAAAFYRGLTINLESIYSLSAIFGGEDIPSRERFGSEAMIILERHGDIQALNWIPNVPDSEREHYEAALQENFPGSYFSERATQGAVVRAKRRETYFPVFYVNPYIGNETAPGFDIASDDARRQSLMKSAEEALPFVTAGVRAVQSDIIGRNFLVFLPQYENVNRMIVDGQNNLRGFVLGVFSLSDIFNTHVIDEFSPVGIEITLMDVTPNAIHDPVLHVHSADLGGEVDESLYYEKKLPDVWGRQWSMVARPTTNYVSEESTLTSVVVFWGGVILTLILSMYIMEISRQAKIIQQTVVNRTKELSHLTDELSRSNRDLEQFAYVASHDLQEPLRMVASFTQLLEKQYGNQLDEKAKGYIDYAVDGSKRMQRLIDDLLQFSRVGRNEMRLSKVDLNDVFDNICSNLVLLIKRTHAKINYQSLPVLQADESQMVLLFQNFITNAIKFTKGNPVVSITAEERDDGWKFTVQDNGIGIDKKYFDKVFVIFQRLHTREEFEGTGVGLAICKRIVGNYGGNLEVESEVGKGTSFSFTLKKDV